MSSEILDEFAIPFRKFVLTRTTPMGFTVPIALLVERNSGSVHHREIVA
jgi:hypothetical protein